ncbi:MAG: S-adenosylmethionine:tRNA ribosyltransferase-isomerase, partial [Propionibacterium sp.]|nr:S-adenosylmethionine:tRNA ribosyltransferase-isomerase [Propionibacterium sp.]
MTTQTVAPARPSTRFREPGDTTAPAPPEYRGLERGEVRLLVATPEQLTHTRFPRLPEHLRAGDLVVVNTSATVPGEIDGHSSRHGPIVLHVATPLPEGSWVVELRTSPDAARPVLDAR